MDLFRYERMVIAYHGCDRKVRDQVLAGNAALKASENDYDWLGRGIYFWEYGYERAREWAEEQKRRKRLEEPAVLGAILHLGNCFDLLDVQYTGILADAYPRFSRALRAYGIQLPENAPLRPDDEDFLLRRGDCAVVNWAVKESEMDTLRTYHSVRGLFQEGETAFPGSSIKRKSHIQIAVRDTTCILGYFLPR